MELGEAVAVPANNMHFASSCPFCEEGSSESRPQDLVNSAAKLRESCTSGDVLGTPEPVGANAWTVIYTHPGSQEIGVSEVRSNPHHLIPGNASLKNHPILEAVEKAKGTISGDIGYDVNGRDNGLWLPTILDDFYAGRKAPPSAGIRWGRLTQDFPDDQFSMAEAAMYETSRQFHDAHEDYSEEVKARLDKLLDTLKHWKLACPEAGPKGKGQVPPPFGLVNRLHQLSMTLAGKLVNSPFKWKRPLYTSRHAIAFADRLRQELLPAKNAK